MDRSFEKYCLTNLYAETRKVKKAGVPLLPSRSAQTERISLKVCRNVKDLDSEEVMRKKITDREDPYRRKRQNRDCLAAQEYDRLDVETECLIEAMNQPARLSQDNLVR